MTPELLIAAEKRQRELGITSRSQFIQMLMRKDIMSGDKDFVISQNSSLESDKTLPHEYSLESVKKEIHKLPRAAAKIIKRAEEEIIKREKHKAQLASALSIDEQAMKDLDHKSKAIVADTSAERQAMNDLPQNDYGKQYQKTATKHYLKQAKITDPDQLEKFFAVDRAKLFPPDKRFESLEEAIESAIADAASCLPR
jgi:hypothetical protein